MSHALVSVAVPVPALDLLTYRVPETEPMPSAGARVIVPLGRRLVTGVVLGEAAAPDGAFELRDIHKVLDPERFLPADVVELTTWVADYYMAGPGAALSVAMPPHALDNRTDAFRTARRVQLTAEGHDLASRDATDDGLASLGARQRDAIGLLKGAPAGLLSHTLTARGVSASVVTRLKAMGLVTVTRERVERDPFESAHAALPDASAPDWSTRVLMVEQQAAVDRLLELSRQARFQVALLRGVTGSGKTEVYLRLADEVRRAGRGVLMLVPEIALTPAVAAVFRAAVRIGGGRAAQRALRRRASRSMAPHPARRGRRSWSAPARRCSRRWRRRG